MQHETAKPNFNRRWHGGINDNRQNDSQYVYLGNLWASPANALVAKVAPLSTGRRDNHVVDLQALAARRGVTAQL